MPSGRVSYALWLRSTSSTRELVSGSFDSFERAQRFAQKFCQGATWTELVRDCYA